MVRFLSNEIRSDGLKSLFMIDFVMIAICSIVIQANKSEVSEEIKLELKREILKLAEKKVKISKMTQ